MANTDLYVQAGGCIWVIGCSYLMIRYADSAVRFNAKHGKRTDKNDLQRFFGFTMLLGIMGAFVLAAKIIFNR